MHFQIKQQIFDSFPDATVGLMLATGIDNSATSSEVLTLLRDQEATLASKMGDGPLIEHPRIAPWRAAYRAFGAKPKKYPSSIESLCRRVLAGKGVPSISTLVDLYNAISLKHLLPAGGEDLAAIQGDVHLTVAGDAEAPARMLGEPEARPPHPGEVIYRDAIGAICRRWNWKEADRTKLTEATRDCILVIEALPPATLQDLQAAVSELSDWVQHYCGGQISTDLLNRENPSTLLRKTISD